MFDSSVVADDEVALTAAALQLGIAMPVLIGNEPKTRMVIDALASPRRNLLARMAPPKSLPNGTRLIFRILST